VGGLYATVSETTSRVIGERQLRVLRELSAHVVDATGPKDALQKTADVVSTSGKYVTHARAFGGRSRTRAKGGLSVLLVAQVGRALC
jgi:hypothetical protein